MIYASSLVCISVYQPSQNNNIRFDIFFVLLFIILFKTKILIYATVEIFIPQS